MAAEKPIDISNTKSEWIDVTYPIFNGMHFNPMDPLDPRVDWVRHPDKHHHMDYLVQLTVNPHTGTHIDAPRHFSKEMVPKRTSIDEIPMDVVIGPARVIEIEDKTAIRRKELERHDIKTGERLLFKTINSTYYRSTEKTWFDNFVAIAPDAALYLVEKKTLIAGIDYIAIAGPDFDDIVFGHVTLFNGGVWIMESLDLYDVKPGNYEMICLPLKVHDGDAAPARVILRPM